MELSCDWRLFQSVFNPARRAAGASADETPAGSKPCFLMVEGGQVLAAFADQEDLSDWVGASIEEVRSQSAHRELISFDVASVDQWTQAALGESRYYEQVESLRRSASGSLGARASSVPVLAPRGRHFLLDALQGWWVRLLPTAYGLLIRVGGRAGAVAEQDLVVIVRRGVFEAFHQPDLSGLAPDKRRVPAEVVRYLAARYFVPFQGVCVDQADWNRWSLASRDQRPWRQVLRALRAGRAKLVPFRWGTGILLGIRALFGI